MSLIHIYPNNLNNDHYQQILKFTKIIIQRSGNHIKITDSEKMPIDSILFSVWSNAVAHSFSICINISISIDSAYNGKLI